TGYSPVPGDATQWPTGASLLWTHSMGFKSAASILSMARSNLLCTPTMRASSSRPSLSLHIRFPRSSLALVRIQPSVAMMVPRAASLPSHLTRTVLSLGLATTLRNASRTLGLLLAILLASPFEPCAAAVEPRQKRAASASASLVVYIFIGCDLPMGQ